MSGIGKDTIVKALVEKLRIAETAIVTDYRGLNVREMKELRKRLRKAGVEYTVTKNTLARLAVKESQREGMEQFLVGPTALAFIQGDPTIPAKVLTVFSKEYPVLEVRGGIFGSQVLSPQEVILWATLPSRNELLAKVAAGLKGPLSNLVFSLKGIMTSFIYTLEAIKDKKDQS